MDMQNHLLSEKHQSVMLSMLSQAMPHLTNTNSDQQLKSTHMDLDPPRTTTSTSAASNDMLTETIDILLGSIQTLNDDTEQLSTEALRTECSLQSLSEDLSQLKIAIQETNASIDALKPNQQILLQDFESFKQDVADQQSVSYDGTLIWRITNVRNKMGT
jgi:chromosome segregation ATPase